MWIMSSLISDAKRLIGRKFNEATVQKDIPNLPFRVLNRDEKPMIQVEFKGETKVFSPEEISAMVLTKMVATAETYLGRKVSAEVDVEAKIWGGLVSSPSESWLNQLRVSEERLSEICINLKKTMRLSNIYPRSKDSVFLSWFVNETIIKLSKGKTLWSYEKDDFHFIHPGVYTSWKPKQKTTVSPKILWPADTSGFPSTLDESLDGVGTLEEECKDVSRGFSIVYYTY